MVHFHKIHSPKTDYRSEINRHIVHASVKVANNWGKKMFDNDEWDLFSHIVPDEFDPDIDPAFVDKDFEYEASMNEGIDVLRSVDPQDV